MITASAACLTRSEESPEATSGDPPTSTTPAPTPVEPSHGKIALPSLEVEGSPGGLVHLEADARATILYFFATWCPPCGPEMEHLGTVRQRFDTDVLALRSITPEIDEEAVEQFWREYDGSWPVLLDPGARAAQEYNVATIPTMVVLAADGTEIDRETGRIGETALTAAVENALERSEQE